MVKGLEGKMDEEQPKSLSLNSVEQRRLRGGLMAAYRGWWAWNRLSRAVVMSPNCRSSRSIWTTLSDIGFDFGWSCVEPGV